MNHDCPAPSGPRTLHPLALPGQLFDPGPVPLLRGAYVDCETTGTDPEYDDVIEIAMLPFTYTVQGHIVHVLHDEAQAWRNDPGRPLTPEIVALTGLTDAMLRGQRIDLDAASALFGASNMVVAHNAKFDRAFFEKTLPAARDKPWACSLDEVPWTEAGFPSRALHCLACSYGVFARGRHRALADCEVGLWLLASVLPHTGQGVFAAMREKAMISTVGLWAVHAPFAAKGLLKARRYRWMPEARAGIAKSWWTELAPECVDAEIDWLREHVYRSFGAGAPRTEEFPQRPITARERWRREPPLGTGHRVQ